MFLANILTVGLLFIAVSAASLTLRLFNNFHKDMRIYLMFMVCTLVGLWSLGLVLVRVAPSYERAFFWQRISALGWTTVYGVLLHLFLSLHKSRFCQTWWTYVLVYGPALLSLTAFSLLPELAQKTQHLVLVNSTWVVLPVMDFWNLLFQFYCTISVVLSSFLLLKLGRRSKDPVQKKQGTFLAVSLLLAIALGILLDRIFIPRHFPELSNLAPGITLLPMTFFYRFIKVYREFWGLKHRQFAHNVAKGEILSETDKVALYRFLGGIHILAGFGYAALAVFAQRPSLENRILWGVAIIFLGMGLYSLTILEIPEKRRDVLVGAVLSCSAFLLWFEITRVLGRSDIFISLSLLPFILPSILSGSRWTLAMVSAVFFSIQAYLWIGPQLMGNPPEVILTQMLVTVLSGLAILVFLLVRQVYLRRLEENRNQLDTQELIANVSSQLIRSRPQDVEENLRNVLSGIAAKLNMPWAFLGVLAEDGSLRYMVYLESRPGSVEPDEFILLKTIAEQNGAPLWVDEKTLLSLDTEHLGKLLARETLRSMVVAPLQHDGPMLGLLILGAHHRMPWSRHHHESLQVLSNVLTEALVRMKTEEQLERMALHDVLTGLPNRKLFMDRLQKALQHAKRTGKPVAVAFLDLDSFKAINDSEGHEVGDQLLKQVAQRFTGCLRESDTVARFGGDEFLILLDDLGKSDETPPVVERILRELQKPFFVGNQEFFLTGSCGIALYPDDGESPEELVQAADLAMYAAKAKGEGHYAFCSPHLKEEAQQRQTLISGLYKAMDRGELVIY